MLPRLRVTVLVVVASFGGGFVSSRLLERNALAQSAPLAATIYVPADGLAFRRFDGRLVARLAYDRRGGQFTVYDSEERPSTTLRADILASGVGGLTSSNPLDMHIQ